MSKKGMLSLVCLAFLLGKLNSQIYIELQTIPENTPGTAKIYIAGNFNNWQPGNQDFELKKNTKGKFAISINAKHEKIVFKFTQGSWEKVECTMSGSDIPNREIFVKQGDSIYLTIVNWKHGEKKHSAGKNVSILKEDFYMPQYDRKRRIWIYLPSDYHSSNRSYPVIYAHDGQNLFDAATSFSGEWGIDETLDSLYLINKKTCIIVGIDHGGEFRLEELTPWPNSKYGGGNANNYAGFIVKTLKPFIDSAYRTLPDRNNTGILGSSLGGLVSFYMALQYPEVFGMAGIFSPSFWFSEQVYEQARQFKASKKPRIYILSGGSESEHLEKETLRMKQILDSKGFKSKNLKVEIVPDGQHSEWFWRREFPKVFKWLVK